MRAGILVVPQRHPAQGALILRARVHALVLTAVFDQQVRAAASSSVGIRRFVERGDLGVERGGHLPAQKASFA